MSKTVSTKRARRPKKIYAKGWETRRRNQEAAQDAALIASATRMGLYQESPTITDPSHSCTTAIGASAEPGANQASQTRPSEVSAGDAIMRTIIMQRNEQLCCFLADMSAVRRFQMGGHKHAPLMVTRSQIEAVEDFLREQGFSEFEPA